MMSGFTSYRMMLAGGLVLIGVLVVRGGAARPEEGLAALNSAVETAATPRDRALAQAELIEGLLASLHADGTELSVLFGLPTAAQRQEAQDTARQIVTLCEDAETTLGQLIDDPASQRQFGGEGAVDDQATRLIHKHDVQLPLRRARALLLLTGTTSDAGLKRRLAVQALKAVELVPPVSTWSDVELGLIQGLAALEMDDPAKAAVELDAAEQVLLGPDVSVALRDRMAPQIVFALCLATLEQQGPGAARSMLAKAMKQPILAGGDRMDPVLALVAADLRFIIDLREVDSTGTMQARQLALAQAFGAYERLLSQSLLAAHEGALRRLVYERIASLCDEGTSFEQLPAIVSLSAATVWGADTDRRAAAITLLEQLLDRESALEAEFRTEAMSALVMLLVAEPTEASMNQAVRLTLLLHESAPTNELTGRTLGVVAAALHAQREGSTVDSARLLRLEEELLAVLRAVHASLSPIEGQDVWRLELIELLVDRASSAASAPAMALLREASAVASSMSFASNARLAAMHALAAPLWRQLRELEEARAPVSAINDAATLLETVTRGPENGAQTTTWPELIGDRPDLARIVIFVLAARSEALLALGEDQQARSVLELLARHDLQTAEQDVNILLDAVRGRAAMRTDDLGALASVLGDVLRVDERAGVQLVRQLSDDAWRDIALQTVGFIADNPAEARFERTVRVFEVLADGLADISLDEARWQQERLGWAQLLSGRPERAASTFEALVTSSPGVAEWWRGLGEAQLAASDDAAAFAAFRRLAQMFEGSGREHGLYWHAWARMLEILERQNEDGSRTATIQREVRRLMQFDVWREHADAADRIRTVGERSGLSLQR